MNCTKSTSGGDVPAVDLDNSAATNATEAGHPAADSPPFGDSAAMSFAEKEAALVRWLSFLLDPSPTTVTELRILGADKTEHGVSAAWIDADPNHRKRMAKMAISESKRATVGAFIIPNPIDPKLLERAPNVLKSPPTKAEKAKGKPALNLTQDADILSRRLVILDLDPMRPTNTMATDAEKAAAWAVVDRVRAFLEAGRDWDSQGRVWPAPGVTDSGNGYHVFYRIDTSILPVGDAYNAATDPLHELLTLLAAEFDTPAAKVDVRVGNPGRIIKAPYSDVRKGKATSERPYRMASVVVWPPDDFETNVITAEQFEAVRAELKRRHPDVKPKVAKAGAGQPTAAKTKVPRISAAKIEERAIKYLAVAGPAIGGQGKGEGEDKTFEVARTIVYGFDLGVERGLALLMQYYSPRCVPPWDEAGMRHKCEEADEKPFNKPRRYMLMSEYDDATMRVGGQPVPSAPPVDPAFAAPTEFAEKDTDPHRLARNFFERIRLSPVRYWREDWFQWHKEKLIYGKIAAKELESLTMSATRDLLVADAALNASEDKVPIITSINSSIIMNTMLAMRSFPGVTIPGDVDPPAYCSGLPMASDRIFVAANGLLDLETGDLLPRNDSAFILGGSGAEFRPMVDPPVRWLAFLSEIFDGDSERIGRLQEWFGYCLTPDTSMQKMLFLLGPPGSGKGTILRVLIELIGLTNTVTFELAGLAERFALSSFVGKMIAVCGDARIDRTVSELGVLSKLLGIVGEDLMNVDRKMRDILTIKLFARFILASNELPRIPDAAAALTRRVMSVTMPKSFTHKRDRHLDRKLIAELSGILSWAIIGWQRIRDQEAFTVIGEDEDTAQEITSLSSPITQFVREEMTWEDDASVDIISVFERYQEWAKKAGMFGMNRITFTRNLLSSNEKLKERVKRQRMKGIDNNDERALMLHGVRLKLV